MPIDAELACSSEYPEQSDAWDETRVILYHLGLGAGDPPTDDGELDYVYERRLKVLPAFAAIPGFEAVRTALHGPGLDYRLSQLLHGEQDIVLHSPLPTAAAIVSTPRVESVHDKGKAALVVLRADARTVEGEQLFTARFGLFIRGEGGFGGPPTPTPPPWEPRGEPIATFEQPTLPQQALIYRLSGDRNPMHVDPGFAAKGGFEQPILHGLCTYGMVCKGVVDHVLGGDVTAMMRWSARFAAPALPGETLVSRLWHQDDVVLVETIVKDRGVVALTRGVAELR